MRYFTITVNGVAYQVAVEETAAPGFAPVAAPASVAAPAPAPAPAAPAPAPASAAASAPAGSAGSTKVTAPIPGSILDIKVKVGDAVKAGQILCILEAMKMENEISAPCDGTVATIDTTKGSAVDSGAVLMTLA